LWTLNCDMILQLLNIVKDNLWTGGMHFRIIVSCLWMNGDTLSNRMLNKRGFILKNNWKNSSWRISLCAKWTESFNWSSLRKIHFLVRHLRRVSFFLRISCFFCRFIWCSTATAIVARVNRVFNFFIFIELFIFKYCYSHKISTVCRLYVQYFYISSQFSNVFYCSAIWFYARRCFLRERLGSISLSNFLHRVHRA